MRISAHGKRHCCNVSCNGAFHSSHVGKSFSNVLSSSGSGLKVAVFLTRFKCLSTTLPLFLPWSVWDEPDNNSPMPFHSSSHSLPFHDNHNESCSKKFTAFAVGKRLHQEHFLEFWRCSVGNRRSLVVDRHRQNMFGLTHLAIEHLAFTTSVPMWKT